MNSSLGKVLSTGDSVLSPLASQQIAGQWEADIVANSSENPNHISPFGSLESFDGATSTYNVAAADLGYWPDYFPEDNVRMPANWYFAWDHPSYCMNAATPPYGPLPEPFTESDVILLPPENSTGATIMFTCFQNTPANPDFAPSEVSPQFVLDDALPTTIQVAAFSSINAAASITKLHVYSMGLSNPANLTAESIGSGGDSAVFPYPRASNGQSLPSGAYITTITTDPVDGAETTNGMEPIYIAHDDTSYTAAFGVDVAIPAETTTKVVFQRNEITGQCASPNVTTNSYGGSSVPLVTLASVGKLAVGSAAAATDVGTEPTVVIAYNGQSFGVQTPLNDGCGSYETSVYTGRSQPSS